MTAISALPRCVRGPATPGSTASNPGTVDGAKPRSTNSRDADGAAEWAVGVSRTQDGGCSKNPLKQVCEGDVDLSKDASPAKPETLHPLFVDNLRNYATREPLVGSVAPDFTLRNLDGETVRLSDLLKDKPVVLLTGSITCTVYRRQAMLRGEQLRRDFGKDVHVLLLYVDEAHPALDPSPLARGQWTHFENVNDGILIRRPTNAEERRAIALVAAERFNLSTTNIVMDTVDNKTWDAYLHLPSAAYVIGKDGKVVYREPWAFREPGASPRPKLFDVVQGLTEPPGS